MSAIKLTAALFAGLLTALLVGACASTPPKEQPAATDTTTKPASAPSEIVPETEKWRSKAPTPKPTPELVLPKIEQGSLRNGLTLMVHERHDLPLVDVRVTLRAGSASEPRDKDGLADLTYEVMLEGAGKRDGVALAEAFADLGTTASVGTSDDGASFHLTVLRRNLDAALALLSEVLQKPRLQKEDFDRKKKEYIATIARQLGSPGFLLMQTGVEVLFGEGHPYGHMGTGTLKSMSAITHRDVKRFHREKVGPRVAAAIFSGDITPEDAKALCLKHLGTWRGRAKTPRRPPAPAVPPRARVVLVEKPGLGQTFIAVGRPGVAAGDADEWTLNIATMVYGGMFSSRLNMNLREDKGYTYGARGWADKRYGVGSLMAFSPVQADKTGAALKEFFAEIEGLKTRPISDDEFATARDGILRSLPGDYETGAAMTSTMAGIFTRALTTDRLAQMVAAHQKMSKDEAQAAAAKYYDPSLMQVILVGDPETIEPQLADLELGTLERRAPAKIPGA